MSPCRCAADPAAAPGVRAPRPVRRASSPVAPCTGRHRPAARPRSRRTGSARPPGTVPGPGDEPRRVGRTRRAAGPATSRRRRYGAGSPAAGAPVRPGSPAGRAAAGRSPGRRGSAPLPRGSPAPVPRAAFRVARRGRRAAVPSLPPHRCAGSRRRPPRRRWCAATRGARPASRSCVAALARPARRAGAGRRGCCRRRCAAPVARGTTGDSAPPTAAGHGRATRVGCRRRTRRPGPADVPPSR
ncbi:hypothetical protein D9M69_484230 [compost metagenome]